jgi:hypothetical protein
MQPLSQVQGAPQIRPQESMVQPPADLPIPVLISIPARTLLPRKGGRECLIAHVSQHYWWQR